MKTIAKDAQGFVSGVMEYLRTEGGSVRSVPKVQSLLNKVTANARKERQAIVQSPVTLTPQEVHELTRILSDIVGHDIHIDHRLNTDLVGGIRIQMADWVVDTSFRGQLEQMAAIFL